MENTNTQNIIVVNGNQYDASEATTEVNSLIQDVATVQNEMNTLKVSYDIAGIARQALMASITSAIESGESGLVAVEETEAETETDTETETEGDA